MEARIIQTDRVPDGYGGWIEGKGYDIQFTILDQLFREAVFIPFELNVDNLDKELIQLVGIKIQELGKKVERQAKFGKATDIFLGPNGTRIRTFGWV